MRRQITIFSLLLALAGGVLFSASATADDTAKTWLTSHKKAVKMAKEKKRLILVDFTGSDWCGWCIRLKKEVFNTDEFKTWAKDNVVLLELDFPRRKKLKAELAEQNNKLLKKYKVRGFPTILFLNADGEVVGKSGYIRGGPKGWIENAKKILAKAKAS